MILKILDRLLLLLRMPKKKVKPISVIKKVKVPEQEINELLDPESDLLSTLLDDALIRESIISHLEICYNYKIKQANDDYLLFPSKFKRGFTVLSIQTMQASE